MMAKCIFWCAFAVLAAACIFVLASCGTYGPPEGLGEYEEPFGVDSTADPDPPLNFNVFIDASASMHGFTEEYKTFKNIINSVVSRIPPKAKIQLYGFGSDSVQLEGDLRKMLHTISNRSFYSQEYTDLCLPFEKHIKDDPNSVNLIFTDMVQSTERAEQDRAIFAKLLKEYLGENGFLALLATQAEFQGEYYTERVNSRIKAPEGSTRPLYCLAFGDRRYAGFIQSKIGDLFAYSFEFGNTLPNQLRYAQPKDLVNDPENFLDEGDDLDLPATWYKLGKGRTDHLGFNFTGYEDRFGRTLDYALAYQGKADTLYTELKGCGGSIQVQPDGERVSFQIPFNQNAKGQYLIRFTFRKTLPAWIAELSTNDDTKPGNLNKTYMLEPWMRFIMDNFEDYKHLATTQYFAYIKRK